MAMTTQPGQEMMMTPPTITPSECPPGLEYLALLDQVTIKQDISLLEVLTDFEAKNSYRILNNQGQYVYSAGEESGFCARLICRTQRGFVYHVVDNYNQEVFRVTRDFHCFGGKRAWPCDCCRYYAEVTDRNGETLGWVSDLFTCCALRPWFGIYTEDKMLKAEIRGPFCAIQNVICSWDIEFPVIEITEDENTVGTIAKTWEGMLKSCFTTADNFNVSFPLDMNVKMKALMIAAVFVIDMMLYEHQEGQK